MAGASVLVPEPTGTPRSIQEMVDEDDSHVESVAAVSHFDMTVADSEDGDLHSFPSVSPRHRLLGDSDTESLVDGASTVSIHSVVEEESTVDVVHDIRGNSVAIREAFLSLDAVDLHTIFAKRAANMKASPRFLRGSFRNVMRVAMDDALQTNEVRRTRVEVVPLVPQDVVAEVATFQEASWCNSLTIFFCRSVDPIVQRQSILRFRCDGGQASQETMPDARR